MEKVRSRFILCTTNAYWAMTVGKTMAKSMSSQIIQINMKLSKKFKTTNISNTENIVWLDEQIDEELRGDSSSIGREKIPVFLAIRKKIIFETIGSGRGTLVHTIL